MGTGVRAWAGAPLCPPDCCPHGLQAGAPCASPGESLGNIGSAQGQEEESRSEEPGPFKGGAELSTWVS